MASMLDLRTKIMCHAWYCDPAQELMAGEIIDNLVKTAIAILLTGNCCQNAS